jgi:hypothetical protein
MQGRSVGRGLALAAAFAAVLVVAVLELAGRDGEPGPISALVLSTRLGPDGQPLLPPPLPPPAGLAICSGPSCGQADPGTQTMMENIKKVLHALDSRLGNMKSAERDWKSTMAHKVRMMSQQVGSLGSEEKKVYFLQQDVKRKLAARGPPGSQGPQGQAGRHGINGGQGPFGAGGPRGIEGVQGKQGPAGIIGAPGIRYACDHFFCEYSFTCTREAALEQPYQTCKTSGKHNTSLPHIHLQAPPAPPHAIRTHAHAHRRSPVGEARGIEASGRGHVWLSAEPLATVCFPESFAHACSCSWNVQWRHGASGPAGQARP